ncbi:hypothetical protein CI102_3418 [Trichoderma harzianum]|nr:hypothetical protein CI102_3418 [Trichoderma harzianum]
MPVRRVKREIRTCSRCRLLKLQCNQSKPSCQRCTRANVTCSLGARSPTNGSDSGSSVSIIDTLPQSEAELSRPSVSHPEHHVSLESNSDKQPGLVKNRQRAQLSCIRCHRLKVKCDKELPCSRCRMSGWGKSCAYHHRAERTGPSNASPQQVAKDPDSVIEAWHSQSRSATHWTEVLSTLKLQAGHNGLQVCDLIPDFIRQQKTGVPDDSIMPENFPFNSPAAAKFASMDAVQELLQRHRENYQSYVDGYLVLYQTSHPIIDTSAFLPLVEAFWNDPKAADMAWLASFLMVLALGCFAVTRDQHATIELCMAAEACLSKTPFMVQPDIIAIRTLCLMVLAKQTVSTTCRTFDSCWTLLGIVTRAAVGMDLHKQRAPLDQSREGIRAWQSSQTLWSIIVYFCVQVATITGKPLLVSADMFTKHSPPSTFQTNDPWVMLIRVYPSICHIISRITSDSEKPLYNEVVKHNDHVRQLMDALLGSIHGKPRLYMALDMFFRRILLVLHRSHALHPAAPLEYQVSYWVSLECSLAILVHHRDLEEQNRPDNTNLLGRLFKLDILSAMLTVCLHLLRREAPLLTGLTIPPRRIILSTLQACVVIWEKEIHYSLCFKIGHFLLVSVLKLLPDIGFLEN